MVLPTNYLGTDETTVVDHAGMHNAVNGQVNQNTADLLIKADLVAGVVPTAQIPALAVTDYLGSVASQVAMLALVGQQGDWCIRSDAGMVYVITGADPTLLVNWTALAYPAAPVTQVNGQTGIVVLNAGDVGADPTGTAAGLVAGKENAGVAAALVDDLSGVTNAPAARTNLGLGSAALSAASAFDPAGTAAGLVTAHESDSTAVHGIADTSTLVLTGDARLSDARTPTAHGHAQSDVTGLVTALAGKEATGVAAALVDDLSGVTNAPAARTNLGLGGAAVLSVGTSAGTVAAGDDARMTNARTPTAHATSHLDNGSDPIATFTSARSGAVPASGGGTANFLRADGTFAAPPSGGSVPAYVALRAVFPLVRVR